MRYNIMGITVNRKAAIVLTENERQDTRMAKLYELRLIFSNGEKKNYTTEEIVELLDKIATAKEQEI